jgi:hypothetical protein
MHTIFWLENLKGRDQSEDTGGVDRKIILTRILEKYDAKVWTEFTWLMIGTRGGLLRTQL